MTAANASRDPGRYIADNHRLWQQWVPLKAASDDYDLDGFRRGGNRMRPLERDEVGPVDGRSLLHLQSHVGLDTLSWARLGARVTGVDFSSHAVEIATGLAADVAPDARFVEADVLTLPDVLTGSYDIVYTSNGVLGWLPDLRTWARVVAHFLVPGGFLYLFEFHPSAWMLDTDTEDPELRLRYSYFGEPAPLSFEYRSPTSVPEARIPDVEYVWGHTMGDLITALADAGLRVDFLHEWPFVGWRLLPFMERDRDGWWRLPGTLPAMPLSFSLRASKPAGSARP
ncbi:class I SAM-dependent methyltransferase [Streptomyces sp. NBC_00111]|uniref:class I SAM-dependent methyltransferase n=1 Tax=unclassified Streptomyces TaxID=2593676 RepID=UPI002E324B55|nr:class I SAM-dependent methyltransferase [Streptomyces sp. NBC_01460]